MIKVEFSNSYKAKKLRIKKLPKMMDGFVEGYVKRDLIEIKKLFHDGIKDDTFNLERLKEATKSGKRAQGMPKPSAPLYGKGDLENDRSYMNMLNIRKLKDSWKLVPSKRLHWSTKIPLDILFKIHENGAKIVKGDKIIQIPPRPALLLAYRRWSIKRRQQDKGKEVRRAITAYINEGRSKILDIIKRFKNK